MSVVFIIFALLTTLSPISVNAKSLAFENKTTTNLSIADPSQIRTKFGLIKGVIDKKNNVLIWKGIPYAKAPIGELRWKKPVDPDKWDMLDATKSGDVAIQLSANGVVGSENSLNLDIYRPNNKANNLPIIVYIHGGNNQSGKAGEIAGNTLVNDIDAIFISVNYRLGPLGFNPLPALRTGDRVEDSGNYALLDIAQSLDWIKENIQNFGGDPNNIIISGFSAGGRDVMAMLISPIFKDKFQKAISFSGGMTIADQIDSVKVFANAISPLVVQDNVKANEKEAYEWLLTNQTEVKDYLYKLAPERLVSLMGDAGIRMSVFPHLYNDGYVLPKAGFNTTTYNLVPLIMLTGTGEFSLFAKSSPYFIDNINADSPTEKTLTEFGFANKYGGKLYSLFNVADSADKMKPYYHADIYGVEIKFGENKSVVGMLMGQYGAFHGVFVPLMDSDNTNYTGLIGDAYKSTGAQELSKIYKKYIYNFIHTGNPNGDSLVKWTILSAENNKNRNLLLYLDANKDNAIVYMGYKDFTYQDVLTEIDNDKSIDDKSKQIITSEVLNGRWFSEALDQKYNNPSLWIN